MNTYTEAYISISALQVFYIAGIAMSIGGIVNNIKCEKNSIYEKIFFTLAMTGLILIATNLNILLSKSILESVQEKKDRISEIELRRKIENQERDRVNKIFEDAKYRIETQLEATNKELYKRIKYKNELLIKNNIKLIKNNINNKKKNKNDD